MHIYSNSYHQKREHTLKFPSPKNWKRIIVGLTAVEVTGAIAAGISELMLPHASWIPPSLSFAGAALEIGLGIGAWHLVNRPPQIRVDLSEPYERYDL